MWTTGGCEKEKEEVPEDGIDTNIKLLSSPEKGKEGYRNISDLRDMVLAKRYMDLCHSPILEEFVAKLEKKAVQKSDEDWRTEGKKIIKESKAAFTENAFLFLSSGAQRLVAIALGKQSENQVISPSVAKLIEWAQKKEKTAKIGLNKMQEDWKNEERMTAEIGLKKAEGDQERRLTQSEFKALPENEQRKVTFEWGKLIDMMCDDSPEPAYAEDGENSVTPKDTALEPSHEKEDCTEKKEETNTASKVSASEPFSFFKGFQPPRGTDTAPPPRKRIKIDKQ